MKDKTEILARITALKKESKTIEKESKSKNISFEKRLGIMIRQTQIPCEISTLQWVLGKK